MHLSRILVLTVAFTSAAAVASAAEWAVTPDHEWCSQHDWNGRYCEVRETELPAPSGTLRIDGATNGGIRVEGWDRGQVLVMAKVTLHERSWSKRAGTAEAREIEILTDGGEIRATGPDRSDGWSVSYRVYVPRRSDLSLSTHNGGISISEVDGDIEFRAQNGGVHLEDLAGNVHGATQNGGLSVELDGYEWDGDGLDVRTTNGGIKLRIPEDYNADLVTGTVNGRMRVDFPIEVRGDLSRRLRTTLGRGGPEVSVVTTNGGVVIEHR